MRSIGEWEPKTTETWTKPGGRKIYLERKGDDIIKTDDELWKLIKYTSYIRAKTFMEMRGYKPI